MNADVGERTRSSRTVGYRSTALGFASSGCVPESASFKNGTRPESSAAIATRRQGQCVIWASRKTSSREPRISGRRGRAKIRITPRAVKAERNRGDIAR